MNVMSSRSCMYMLSSHMCLRRHIYPCIPFISYIISSHNTFPYLLCLLNFQTDYPYVPLTDSSEGCPGEYDSSNAYDTGDTVEDNGVVFTCSGAAAFCNLNAPNLRSVGVHYWKPTNSCTGTVNPTESPVFINPQDGCPEEFIPAPPTKQMIVSL